MLVCVAMLCTCFIVYISHMDWRKAAEEVTAHRGSMPTLLDGPRQPHCDRGGLGWQNPGFCIRDHGHFPALGSSPRLSTAQE